MSTDLYAILNNHLCLGMEEVIKRGDFWEDYAPEWNISLVFRRKVSYAGTVCSAMDQRKVGRDEWYALKSQAVPAKERQDVYLGDGFALFAMTVYTKRMTDVIPTDIVLNNGTITVIQTGKYEYTVFDRGVERLKTHRFTDAVKKACQITPGNPKRRSFTVKLGSAYRENLQALVDYFDYLRYDPETAKNPLIQEAVSGFQFIDNEISIWIQDGLDPHTGEWKR